MSSETGDGFQFQDGDGERDRVEEVREIIRETLAPHTKSEQYFDHPDAPEKHPGSAERPPEQDHHNDGEDIYKSFGLERMSKFLARAERMDHPTARHPEALAHFLTHVEKWEKWELGEDDPDFSGIPDQRRELFEWYLGYDIEEVPSQKSISLEKHREKVSEARIERLRPGGTGLIIHGEQGTTKTTGIHWLITNIMEANQMENVIWQSTLDDTEWTVFSPWATMCLPEGVDVRVTANPYSREYKDLGAIELEPEDICRQVIRYENPSQLLDTIAGRRSGQFYVLYPDPEFRRCQALTGYPYDSIWQVGDSDEATDIKHFWFAVMQAVAQSVEYNDWTTLVGDEAHKWLSEGASDSEHKWHKKIKQWATYWGDARKKRLSCILSIHQWHELHWMVREKVRWGATMNGEDFPSAAPLDGSNTGDQSLGDTCIWTNRKWNHVGYPDIKRKFSVPADIKVTYPRFEAEKQAKS